MKVHIKSHERDTNLQIDELIQEENYEENFKRHEDVIAGVEDEDLDMEQIFKDAEAALEEDEDT